MNENEIAEVFVSRATDGMKYLDEFYPDWVKKIDLSELNMLTSTKCILGQLFGNYYTHCGAGGALWKDIPRHVTPVEYGFQVGLYDHGYSYRIYGVLTDVWIKLISERREA